MADSRPPRPDGVTRLQTMSIRQQSGGSPQTMATRLGLAVMERPQRWDQPFDPEMKDSTVDRLLHFPPFKDMDPSNFGLSTPLRGILKNDTASRYYEEGDIVVRQGDYGNSAFMILRGSVRVVLDDGDSLPQAALGRSELRKKGLFRSIKRWWRGSYEAEARKLEPPESSEGVGSRHDATGAVRIFLQDIPAVLNEAKTVRLGPGEFFGETAALGRIPRTATVFAEENSHLLEIRWQGLRDIMRRDAKLREHIDELYRRNNLEQHLLETPMFRHLAHAGAPSGCDCAKCHAMDKIRRAAVFETFGDFEWYATYKKLVGEDPAARVRKEPVIAQEGHYPNGLLTVRSGFVRVTHKFGNGERTVAYLGRGQSYGQDEVIYNWKNPDEQLPLQNSLRAVGYAAVLLIPTGIIERYVLGTDRGRPGIPFELLPEPLNVFDDPESSDKEEREDLLEFLVERRMVNGTRAMAINLNRCIQCDECVRACSATHENNPRFIRHGQRFENLMITNACMHCADPVCMIGCPTGAIHRDLGGGEVVINDSTCVGCGTCAQSCPYDNIRMVEIRDNKGRFLVDPSTKLPIQKATKCDLCYEHVGGPACQRACPHDALKRIDLSQGIEPLKEWLSL